MTRHVHVGDLAQLPPGEGRTYDVGHQRIAVFHTRSGAVYAAQAECPHRGGPLADGLIGAATVICPLHDRAFDLRTGECAQADCAIAVYPVALDSAGAIWVEVSG